MAASNEGKASMDWKDKLIINYKLIVEEARLKDVLDSLYSEGIFSQEEMETISQFDGLENETNRKFIDILLLKNESSYKKFLWYLTVNGRSDLTDIINNTSISRKQKKSRIFQASADWKEKLLRNYKTIVLESDLQSILDDLYSGGILTGEEKDNVRARKTTNNKNRLMLKLLLQKTEEEYESFLGYLKEMKNEELAELIDKTRIKETPIYTREIQTTEEIKLKRRVFRMRQEIIVVSNLETFLDDFITTRVFDIDDLDNLESATSRREKNRLIIDVLFRKNYSCFGLLMELLKSNVKLCTEIESTAVDETVDKEIKDMYFLSTQADIIPMTKRDQVEVQLKSWNESTYVEVHSSQAVLESARRNTIVTVTGHSGTGKTSTIHYVGLKLAEEGYDVLPVSDVNELMRYLHPGYKQVFVIDNPVGSQKLDEDELELWVMKNEVLNNLRVENTKILCSVRKEMVIDRAFRRSRSALGKNITDLQDRSNALTTDEKVSILESHLKDHFFTITDELKEVITGVNESFPLLCKMFSCNEIFKESNVDFFRNPYALLRRDLDEMSREKYCVLILCLCHAPLVARDFIETSEIRERSTNYSISFSNIFNACKLDPSTPIESLREQLDSLTKVYLKKDGLFYDFSHAVTRDVVACHFGNSKQIPFLNICRSEQICDLVSVKTLERPENLNTILLEKQNIPDLILRLLTDIQNGEYNPAILHSCWDDADVLRVFVDMLGDRRLISKCLKSDVINIFCKSKNEREEIGSYEIEEDMTEFESIATPYSPYHEDRSSAVGNQNITESWSWNYTVLQCLELPRVTAMHWIAAFSRKRLFTIIWRNLSEKQKKQLATNIPLLHFAFLGGDREICTSVLETQSFGIPGTPLIDKKETDCVMKLLPEHFAVMKNSEVENLLIHQHTDVNRLTSEDGYTPLFIAAGYGNSFAARRLIINNCADVNKCSKDGWSPLMISVQNSHTDLTELLLDNGANVNKGDENGWNPLHIAVQNNNLKAASLLLKHGANVDQSDRENRTPMLKAVQKGFQEMAVLLLGNHASVKKRNENGNCPLHIVAQNNDIETANILFKKAGKELDLESHNKYGNSPLQVAVKNDSHEVAELLIINKAEINNRDQRGRTPLVNAVLKGNKKMANLLIKNKPGIDISSNNGNSPLHTVVQEDNIELAELLIQNGADINLPDGSWNSPLLKALFFMHTELACVLINKGADVNQCNRDGMTPLMVAAQSNLMQVASVLIENGADKDSLSLHGTKAYQFSTTLPMARITASKIEDHDVQQHIKAIVEREKKTNAFNAPAIPPRDETKMRPAENRPVPNQGNNKQQHIKTIVERVDMASMHFRGKPQKTPATNNIQVPDHYLHASPQVLLARDVSEDYGLQITNRPPSTPRPLSRTRFTSSKQGPQCPSTI